MVQAVQEPASPVRGAKLWPMSVEAYHVLGEAGAIGKNTELLYGLVYAKMAKAPFHSFLPRRLLEFIQLLNLRGFLVMSEQALTFIDSEPEPDIAIVKGSNEDFLKSHPTTAELVVEICVTSHDYDRSKLRAYATAQVKECWLVLAPEKRVEVHSNPADGKFGTVAIHGPSGLLRCGAVPDLNLDLDAFWKGESPRH